MQLRQYQTELINKTREAFKFGYKRVLVTLPCGAGKTVCFSYMAHEHVKRGGRVWFLVHRRELVNQARAVVGDNPNIYVGMIRSKKPFTPTLIIFDEAHHSTASTWKKIIDENPDTYIIGLTATPCRLDGSGLGTIYEQLIIGVESDWLIEHKYLSPYDYYAPSNYARDFSSDTENQYATLDGKIHGDVLRYITNKKTIIYCPNIKFSQALSALIPNAVHFDGNTPDKERELIIREFREGTIRCLLNVDLIGEGLDIPDCECVILLRPTMSTALFIQQSMRCLRYVDGKRAVIYDLVGNVFRHGLPTEHREWSLSKKISAKSEDSVNCRRCQSCMLIYAGQDRICPYCGHDNGKTKRQIEIEKQEQLELIKKVERRQVGMCRTLNELIELGRQRGYKNPAYWAKCVMNGRHNNTKRI